MPLLWERSARDEVCDITYPGQQLGGGSLPVWSAPVSWSGTWESCTLKTVQISTKHREEMSWSFFFFKKKIFLFQWQSHGGFVEIL